VVLTDCLCRQLASKRNWAYLPVHWLRCRIIKMECAGGLAFSQFFLIDSNPLLTQKLKLG
jgi:hypothetical protein